MNYFKDKIKYIGLGIFTALVVLTFISSYASFYFYKKYKWAKVNPGNINVYSDENLKIASRSEKHRIILFGDSRIYQWKNFQNINNCEIINRGIDGDTTAYALIRLENDVIKLKPDIVIIELGINDLTAIGVWPEKYDFITDHCIMNLNKIIETVLKNNADIIILSIFPNSDVSIVRRFVWSNRIEYAVREVNSYMKRINKTKVYFLSCDDLFISENRIKRELYSDTLHIKLKAYEEINTRIYPVIKNIIQSKMEHL